MLSTLPFSALGQTLLSQLEPPWLAGEALHAVSPFTCPTRAVAGGTPVAVLISIVALGAVLHAGRVCQGMKRICLGIKYDTCLPNFYMLPTVHHGGWGDAGGRRQCPCGLMGIPGAKMNVQEIESTIRTLGVEKKQRSEWMGSVGQDRNHRLLK